MQKPHTATAWNPITDILATNAEMLPAYTHQLQLVTASKGLLLLGESNNPKFTSTGNSYIRQKGQGDSECKSHYDEFQSQKGGNHQVNKDKNQNQTYSIPIKPKNQGLILNRFCPNSNSYLHKGYQSLIKH